MEWWVYVLVCECVCCFVAGGAIVGGLVGCRCWFVGGMCVNGLTGWAVDVFVGWCRQTDRLVRGWPAGMKQKVQVSNVVRK